MTFLNRKQKKKEIRDAYDGFLNMVLKYWEMIYLSSHDYRITIENYQYLINNQSVYAGTQIQHIAEQFFFSLVNTIVPVIDYYDGKLNEATANQMSNASREHMHEMMKAYDAIALEYLTEQQRKTEEKKKQEEKTETQTHSDEEKLIRSITLLLDKYRPILCNKQFSIEKMDLNARQSVVLNRAGVKKVADLFVVESAALKHMGLTQLAFFWKKLKLYAQIVIQKN